MKKLSISLFVALCVAAALAPAAGAGAKLPTGKYKCEGTLKSVKFKADSTYKQSGESGKYKDKSRQRVKFKTGPLEGFKADWGEEGNGAFINIYQGTSAGELCHLK